MDHVGVTVELLPEPVQVQLSATIDESRFKDAQENQIKDKQKTNEYLEAKTRYLQSKKITEAAEMKYNTERVERYIDFDDAKIWEKAEASLSPAKPNVPAYITLAGVIGLVVGVGLAFFIEYLDTSVKTLENAIWEAQRPKLVRAFREAGPEAVQGFRRVLSGLIR